MASPTRILYVSSEVAPFTEESPTADLVRTLPDQLKKAGSYDVRLMMPRYGFISERKNHLHEVIRLSGTDIAMRGDTKSLKVKVATVPESRLQVYFMDSDEYFGAKGIYTDGDGKAIDRTTDRALFFARSVLRTLAKLRWAPDVLHAVGSISSFVPYVLRKEYGEEELFASTLSAFTPDALDAQPVLAADGLDAELDPSLAGQPLTATGSFYADLSILGPHAEADPSAVALPSLEDAGSKVAGLYDQISNEVLA